MSGQTVVVEPATFTLVDFDAAEIAALVAEAGIVGRADRGRRGARPGRRGVAAGPGRRSSRSIPIVLAVEGGAFEDLKQHPPARSRRGADRRRPRCSPGSPTGDGPGFAGAPHEAELTVPELDCWDAWALGPGVAQRPARCRRSGGATGSATGTGSPTSPTRCSTGCGRPTTSRGPTSRRRARRRPRRGPTAA